MELFFTISGISIMFLGLVTIYNIAQSVILRNELNKYINNNNNNNFNFKDEQKENC